MSEQQATTTLPIDLTIVIDTSVSMRDEAQALSEAAQAAIEAAKSSCPSDLRVTWLGIEGTWKGTHFDRSLRDYLLKQGGIAEPNLRSRKRGELAGGGAQEDAARAIEDIATYFDWRPEATRAIFYLGDEALEGGGDKTEQKDIEAANRAIKTAQEVGVTVHTYFGTSKSKFKDTLLKEYARVAHEAGGQAFTDQDTLQGFQEMMEKVICGSRNPSLYHSIPESLELDKGPISDVAKTEDEHLHRELVATAQAERQAGAQGLVKNYVLVAIGLGLVPAPLLDLAVLMALEVKLVHGLAEHYHVPFMENLTKSLVASLLSGAGSVVAFMGLASLAKSVPFLGTLGGMGGVAITAGAVTYAVGQVFICHFEAGGTLLDFEPKKMQLQFKREVKKGRTVAEQEI